jgi:hypothetical protein
MELDDEVKSASARLTDAVNAAAGESESVNDAVSRLREMGYEPRLSFQLELARIEPLREAGELADGMEEDFSEEDRRALRRMLIRVR